MCEMCPQKSNLGFGPSRRGLLLGAASLLLTNAAGAKENKAPPKPENVLSPDAALKRLMK